MRIAVIGAGALGGTFATLLEGAGHTVTVAARGRALDVIRADGIHLTGGFGDLTAHPAAVELLAETPQLTLVCTKAQDAATAITANTAVLDGSPVIIVQNGLDGVATARRILPNSDCFGALAIIAANYAAPGLVTVTTPAPTYIGHDSGEIDAGTLAWQGVLDAAFPTIAIGNFVGAQWTKLVVNMLNALPAVTGLSVQAVVDDAGLRRILTASMRETVRVGMNRGVQFGALQGLGDRRLRGFAGLPLAIGQLLPRLMRARMGDVPNLGSTLQSLRRGQLTEIDFLNGVVVREAATAGVGAPVNTLLTALVHEVEAAGQPLSPAEVLARCAPLRLR